MISTREANLDRLQRLFKKAMRELLVALFPAGKSLTALRDDHVSETMSEGKKLTWQHLGREYLILPFESEFS